MSSRISPPFPEDDNGKQLCPRCFSFLRPAVGRRIGFEGTLIWWRCAACGAVSEAMPLPPSMDKLPLRDILEGRLLHY